MSTAMPRLHVRRRVDDTESPVSAMLKLNPMAAGLVLFESVMGGETRGRYSFIGMAPDLWWRVKAGKAETSLRPDFKEVLLASVPPLVNTISSGHAPIRSATSLRACSTASRTKAEDRYWPDGECQFPAKYGIMASRTAG